MKKFIITCLSFIRSKTFFWVIVGILVFQAVWFALTARYPMAFDENFHFGIIQLFAHQWSLFFTNTPPDSAQYGDLIRNPSYLYQYLMSFPYRFITLFTDSQTAQVIILRLLNVGIFAAGLYAFRQLLLRLKMPSGVTNIALLMLVLIPVVPFLAGQINYDNLVFLVIPVVMLLTLTCRQVLQKTGALPPKQLILLISIGMLGSLIKYAFLPIFFALFVYLLIALLRDKRRRRVLPNTWKAFMSLSTWLKVGLITLLLLAGGLFAERYGVNIVSYHSLQPNCSKLQSVEDCLQYGPWARNYNIATDNSSQANVPLNPSLELFAPKWAQGMMHRLYFAINYNYYNNPELPVIYLTAFITGGLGLILTLIFWRTLRRDHPYIYLAVIVTTLYVSSLIYVNFTDYLEYRRMLAINGRYLILILPLVFALFATSYGLALQKFRPKHATYYKLGLTALVLLLTLQGAGLLTYIVRSDSGWYWQNQLVTDTNLTVQKAITPLIIGAGEKF